MSRPCWNFEAELEERCNDRMDELENRIAKLEKWAHEPFDFSLLIKRIEALEKGTVYVE